MDEEYLEVRGLGPNTARVRSWERERCGTLGFGGVCSLALPEGGQMGYGSIFFTMLERMMAVMPTSVVVAVLLSVSVLAEGCASRCRSDMELEVRRACAAPCEAKGGRYKSENVMWPGSEMVCELPASDEGKRCSSSAGCQKRFCRCPEDVEAEAQSLCLDERRDPVASCTLPERKIEGICQRFVPASAFRCVVEQGQARVEYVDH